MIDRTHPQFDSMVAALRNRTIDGFIFVDWLQEVGATCQWDVSLVDVVELYALPPVERVPQAKKLFGWPVVRVSDPLGDDSLRPILVAWCKQFEPRTARSGCLYWRWQEVQLQQPNGNSPEWDRELKRRVLSLFDDDVWKPSLLIPRSEVVTELYALMQPRDLGRAK